MADVKRVRYFDHQFLQVADFTDEQDYHRRMRRVHNSTLHTPGVAFGLDVKAAAGATSVTVAPGSAIDALGQDIVLDSQRGVDLGGLSAAQDVYILIAYAEEDTDDVGDDPTRTTELPAVTYATSAPGDGTHLVLGKVHWNGASVDTEVDISEVRRAGVVAGDLSTSSLTVQVAGAATSTWPRLSAPAAGTAALSSALGVGGALSVSGALTVTGGAITPALGNAAAAGIYFPVNPGGGGGDEAFIRYFVDADAPGATPETTKLQIGVNNDPDDRLGLLQAGAERLTIYKGNVGIGTQTPTEPLDVTGDVALSGKHAFRSGDAWLRLNQDGAFASGVHTPGLLAPGQVNVGGVNNWAAPGSGNVIVQGNVAVGAADFASARMHVAGTLAVTGGAITPAVGNAAAAGIYFPANPGGGGGDEAFIRYFVDTGAPNAVPETTKLQIGINNDADDRLGLLQAGAERLTIYNGNVGIGTQTPSEALDVNGDVALSGKHAFRSNDPWLRLNQDGAFTSGVHTPGVLAPGRLNVGGVGNWGDPGPGNAWVAGSLSIGGVTDPKGNSLHVTGRIRANVEDIPNQPVHALPTGWGGGVHTFDVYCDGGSVAVGSNGSRNATLWNNGSLETKTKAFRIAHPLRPDEADLVHASLEGPEHGVLYRGEGRLERGTATIELPEYFEALCRGPGRTVQLTPRVGAGEAAGVLGAGPVEDGRFVVTAGTGAPDDQAFYWEVKAVRADVDRLEVEVDNDRQEVAA